MRRCGWRDDEGSVTPFVVLMVGTLMLVIGLSVDGAAALAASGKALDEATAATRLAAQQVDVDHLRRTREVVLDVPAATAAGQHFIAATGDTGTVVVSPGSAEDSLRAARGVQEPSVTVTVSRTVRTQFLWLVGIDSITRTVKATSAPIVAGSIP